MQYDTVQRWIAESRVELERARLLTYRCAWRLRRYADPSGAGLGSPAADR
ncbi:hypothetical protein [Bradyrhizobium sp. RDI18]